MESVANALYLLAASHAFPIYADMMMMFGLLCERRNQLCHNNS